MKYAKQVNPETPGLTDNFINEGQILINACNAAHDANIGNKEKLEQLVQAFRQYTKNVNPNKVFLDSSILLSSVTGEYSLVA